MTEPLPPREKRQNLLRVTFAVLKLLLAIYLCLLTGLYSCQRYVEYVAVSPYPGTPKQNGVGEMSIVTVRTPDNLSLIGWFAGPKKPNGKIVVLFHGQGIHIGYNAFKARYFLDAGYGIFMAEYRGFAGNPGSPTEEGLYNDGRGVMQWLKDQHYPPSQVVVYGESLGTGVAVEIAAEFPVAGLILEAPYSSAVEIGEMRYPFFPISFLMKDHLDSLSKIGRVKAPLLVVHGSEDTIIPIKYSRKLFDAANEPKQFITMQGIGHPPELYQHGAGKMMIGWLNKQFGTKP